MRELKRPELEATAVCGQAVAPRPLAGLRALDLSRSVAGGFCAQWLAELGAAVTRVVPPESALPPEVRALAPPRRAALEAWLHGGKSLVSTGSADARDPSFLNCCDWVVEDWSAAERSGLAWDSVLAGMSAPPIDVSVTDFGCVETPEKEAPTESLRYAWAGQSAAENWDRSPHPATALGWNASAIGGLFAAAGALLALLARRRGQGGRHIEHAVVAGLASLHPLAFERWFADGAMPRPPPAAVHRTRDGYVVAAFSNETPLELLAALTGDAVFTEDPRLAEPARRAAFLGPGRRGEIHARLAHWLAEQPRDGAVERAQALQLPFGRVRALAEILAEPHFIAREFWRKAWAPGLGEVTLPGLPFRVLTPQPPLHPVERGGHALTPGPFLPSPQTPRVPGSGLPLAGLRVLELSAAWAGPMVGRMLAEYGAEVVRIEGPQGFAKASHAAETSRAAESRLARAAHHRGKASVALVLSSEPGQELLRRLAARADVLIENFRPGVLEGWGCGYDDLTQRNPALIVLSLSGFGRGGPLEGWRALGPAIEGEAGWADLAAGSDGSPHLHLEPLTDPVAALHGLSALLAFLIARDTTGTGVHIDLSQAECALRQIGDRLALASTGQANAAPGPTGNAASSLANAPIARGIAALGSWDYLRERGCFIRIATPEGDEATHFRTPIRISGVEPKQSPAAAPGADTRRILKEWLSLGEADIDKLTWRGTDPRA